MERGREIEREGGKVGRWREEGEIEREGGRRGMKKNGSFLTEK